VFVAAWALRSVASANAPSPMEALGNAFGGTPAGGRSLLVDLATQAGGMGMLVGAAMVVIAYFAMLRE
jgi:hypothetical protein